MNKETVIKGLECCGQVAYKCKECPYQHFGSEDCVGELTKDALAVIRKQEDEIYFGGNYESGYKRGRADERRKIEEEYSRIGELIKEDTLRANNLIDRMQKKLEESL